MEVLDVFKEGSCPALLGPRMPGKTWWELQLAGLRESGFKRHLNARGRVGKGCFLCCWTLAHLRPT